MRRGTLAAVLATAAVAGCSSHHEDPCEFRSPGARWIAFASQEAGALPDIHLVRADGTCRRALTSDPVTDTRPAFGPNGVLAYESDRAPLPSVWIQDVETGSERRLDVGGLRAVSPAFSPDGARIAFEGRPSGEVRGSIYIVSAAGGTPQELTPEATRHGNGGPAFSPDGTTVFFVSDRRVRGAYEIWKVPSAGGADPEQVTTGSLIEGKPAVSPDGRLLAYAQKVGSSTEVVLLDPATGTTTSLGIPGSADPAFDPGGGRLVVQAPHGLARTLDLVTLPSGAAVRVTAGRGPDGAPAFAR